MTSLSTLVRAGLVAVLCMLVAGCNKTTTGTTTDTTGSASVKGSKVRAKTSRTHKLKTKKSAYVGSTGRKIGALRVNKPWKCVPKSLKIVIDQIRKRYGPVTINSTHRSRKHNRRAGGKRGSMHLHCRAVDFRVRGNTRGLTRWLARHRLVGGYKRYRSGYYHIDNGPKRTW